MGIIYVKPAPRLSQGGNILKPHEKKRLIRYGKNLITKGGLDEQVFDWDAEIDSSLQYSEAKNILMDMLQERKLYIADSPKPSIVRELVKEQDAEIREAQMADMQRISSEHNRILAEANKEIDEIYYPLDRRIQLVGKGDYNFLAIKSLPGLGKSFRVNKVLTEDKIEFVVIQGKVTEGKLYRVLHEHNGKVIVFRDTRKILESISSLDILKSATETTGGRIIWNATYGKQQTDLPEQFEFNGKIIFEVNGSPKTNNQEDLEALYSRGSYTEFIMSMQEVVKVMWQICKTDDDRIVTQYLIDNKLKIGRTNFNLRTQNEAFRLFLASKRDGKDWKAEIDLLIREIWSEGQKLLYQVCGEGMALRSEFEIFVARVKHVGLRRAQMIVCDWLTMGDLFADRGYGSHVSINPIEEGVVEVL